MPDKNLSPNTVARYLSYAVATVLVLLPFHALFTTWLGSNLDHLDAWRIWKEVVIVAMLPFALYLCWVTPHLRQWFKRDWLLRLCLAYAVLFVGLGLWALYRHHVTNSALIYGLLSDLRFF